MRRLTPLPELLAPAGSEEALYAAVEGGADAVYLSGKLYGARAYAHNFDNESLQKAVLYCHLHGVKVYVAVNILLYDRELSDALSFCGELYRMGVDALICADLGLIRLLRTYLPDMEIHASTQMGIHNLAGANLAAEWGIRRVVLAREMSLREIRFVTEACRTEVEVFVHGALCVCHSGQCLFSSLVGARSGNRGQCAQPCRLPYNGARNYPLSLRDLSAAAHVRELLDSGVSSLKIEGRMKSPAYVYHVCRVYRTLLDEARNATPEEEKLLAAAFCRGGFTDGYLSGQIRTPMTGVRSAEEKSDSRALAVHTYTPRRVPVRAAVTVMPGHGACLTLTCGERNVCVTGDCPSPAQSAPLRADELVARLCKTGNTPFSLKPEDVSVTLGDNLFLSAGQINGLRRAATAALCAAVAPERRTIPLPQKVPACPPAADSVMRTALFLRGGTLLGTRPQTRAWFDRIFVPLTEWEACAAMAHGVYVPPVIMEHEWAAVRRLAVAARAGGARYALIGNLSHLSLAKEVGWIPVADFRMNILNSHTASFLREVGVSHQILSPELTLAQMADIRGSAIVSGRVPLMLTERCFIRENSGGCDACAHFSLTDRIGKKFPVLREYEHRNLICNAVPTYMGDRVGALAAAGCRGGHFLFTTESAAEADRAVARYRAAAPAPDDCRRIRLR